IADELAHPRLDLARNWIVPGPTRVHPAAAVRKIDYPGAASERVVGVDRTNPLLDGGIAHDLMGSFVGERMAADVDVYLVLLKQRAECSGIDGRLVLAVRLTVTDDDDPPIALVGA